MEPKIVATNDTIIAPASGAGLAAIAVIRISGPATRDVLDALCGGTPPPRHASLRAIGLQNGPLIDRGLVLWFPGPQSFTGEDMAELHVHGSRAVIGAIIDAVLTLPGMRLAERGELFTSMQEGVAAQVLIAAVECKCEGHSRWDRLS
jgi:tRNA modification GTPase